MKELFGTLNTSIQNQTNNFNAANQATQTSIAEIQTKFLGIEEALAGILAGQAKSKNARGSDGDHDAKKARGSEDWQIRGAVQPAQSIVSSTKSKQSTSQWWC